MTKKPAASSKPTDAFGAASATSPTALMPGKPVPLLLQHDKKLDLSRAANAFERRAKKYDPAKLEEFEHGIYTRDVALVKGALEHGVDGATLIGTIHPLMVLMYNQKKLTDGVVANSKYPEGMTEQQYDAQTTELIDILLESGVKLREPTVYADKHCRNLMDHLLMSSRYNDLATLVIHALDEGRKSGRGPYEVDLEAIVEKKLDYYASQGDTDEKGTVAMSLRQFAQLHTIVKARLTDPETALEWDLSTGAKSNLGTWVQDYNLPSLHNFLPRPKEEEAKKVAEKTAAAVKQKGAEDKATASTAGAIDDDLKKFITVLKKRKPEEVMADIMALSGNKDFKEKAETELLDRALVAMRAAHGLHDEEKPLHMALTGSTGTGKTTLARLDAEYLYAIGFGGPNFAEVSRKDLMLPHIGGTDALMKRILETAHFVFIDEAPQLVMASMESAEKRDFGSRVVEAVIPALENNRHWQVCYFAGYTKQMEAFLNSDPGLRGRIGRTQHIEDPNRDMLKDALEGMLEKRDLKMGDDAKEYLMDRAMEARTKLGEFFSNYRAIRTITDNLRPIMARRLLSAQLGFAAKGNPMMAGTLMEAPSKEALMTVTLEDVKKLDLGSILGYTSYEKAKDKTAEGSGYQGTHAGFTGTLRPR